MKPYAPRLPKHATVEDRLLARGEIDPLTGCWNWQAAIDGGYGVIVISRKRYYAHRLSYETFVGPIPDGLHIDHLCRNRACFAPSHLEPVTCRINVLRGESPGARNRRRTHCPKRGHAYAEHGVVRDGRLRCRTCHLEYMRQYHLTPRDPSVDRRRKPRAA